jgi:hypothetical protein
MNPDLSFTDYKEPTNYKIQFRDQVPLGPGHMNGHGGGGAPSLPSQPGPWPK